jgi:hypothetical protein
MMVTDGPRIAKLIDRPIYRPVAIWFDGIDTKKDCIS